MKKAEEQQSKTIEIKYELLDYQEQINLIKQIQLDAWKQGMNDAAKICANKYEHPL